MSSNSPTERKLLQKLQPLLSAPTQSSAAFTESQQTIASWMIFNRKKREALAEGLGTAIKDSDTAEKKSDSLLVLLKVVHRALVTNCPTIGESGADASIWEKSAQLRRILVEKVAGTLLYELGSCLDGGSAIVAQVEDMLKTWETQNVCEFAWGDLTQMWEDGLKKKDNEISSAENLHDEAAPKADEGESIEPIDKAESEKNADTPAATEQTSEDSPEEIAAIEEKVATNEDTPSSENKRARFSRQDSAMSTASIASVGEIDYEGVEEARVEPHRFSEAAKVIAQLQITRDIGSDTAMNLSSAFGRISPEVEEICKVMNQQNGDEDDAAKETRTKILSTLPDDFLDLDLKYAKQSLQTYKEAIRQQRRARLQCLHMLLQSRCSFGSMDAARILFGKEKNEDNTTADAEIPVNDILDKLKKKKEALADALALEGLDVEEDAEEEKKLEKEEKNMVPFSWFVEEDEEPANDNVLDDLDDEPAAKKLKSA